MVRGMLVLVCLLALGPGRALATTYYVAPSGGGGCSTNVNSPQGGFANGIGCLAGGDTLILATGTYATEAIPSCTIPSGSAGQHTIIKAAEARGAVLAFPHAGTLFELGAGCTQEYITFDGLVIDKQNEASGEGYFWRDGTRHLLIQNGEVRNFLGTGTCAPSQAFGGGYFESDIVVRNNKFHDLGTDDPPPSPESCNYTYGTYISGGNGLVLDGNEWYNISAFAIHHYNGGGSGLVGTEIMNNFFHDTGTVLVTDGSNAKVHNNVLLRVGTTVYPYRSEGLSIGVSDSQVYNNTIIDSRGECLNANGSGTLVANNICQGNGADSMSLGGGASASHNFPVDVGGQTQFVNPGSDFHLLAGSAMIDAGIPIAGLAYNGSAPDLGAYEYGGSGPGPTPSVPLPPARNLRVVSAP